MQIIFSENLKKLYNKEEHNNKDKYEKQLKYGETDYYNKNNSKYKREGPIENATFQYNEINVDDAKT